jgi:hypothetical protein
MSKQRHLVDETGRVFCGMRAKDVDVEMCLACSRLETHDLDSRRPHVVCRSAEDLQRERLASEA